MLKFDLAVRDGKVIIPKVGMVNADIGIAKGRIAEISESIASSQAAETVDAKGKAVFPGAIDPHFHVGIYRPMAEDAVSESGAAASGGVTTILSFFRTGKNYLNRMGPYKEIFPQILEVSRSSFRVDYSYHLAIMTRTQLGEIEWLVREAGVSQFKYYMFYKTLDLAGSSKGDSYLMINEPIDLGFLSDLMREVARVNAKLGQNGTVRLAIHCEEPEIIAACSRRVKESGGCGNLTRDYCDGRPSWSEGLAIQQAGTLAYYAGCPINIVHLSSEEAVRAARRLTAIYPELDMMKEATLHHLALSHTSDYGIEGKVNPPIRSREDVEFLWGAIKSGEIDTIVSDHACLPKAIKKGDLWTALPGFGGTSLIFPVMISEGYYRRGLDLQRIAELTSLNAAVKHNLYPRKGSIMVGGDADLAIVNLEKERPVTTDALYSAQDYTPFEGMPLKGWVDCTILRGKVVFDQRGLVGKPGYGEYLRRSAASVEKS